MLMQRALRIKNNTSLKSLMQDMQAIFHRRDFLQQVLQRGEFHYPLLYFLLAGSFLHGQDSLTNTSAFRPKREGRKFCPFVFAFEAITLESPAHWSAYQILSSEYTEVYDDCIGIFKADGMREHLKTVNTTASFVEWSVSWKCCMCAILCRKQNKPMRGRFSKSCLLKGHKKAADYISLF